MGHQNPDEIRTSTIGVTAPAAETSAGRSVCGRRSVLSRLSPFDADSFLAAELMVFASVIACFSRAQSDTYWHLAAGRAMSQSGRVMLLDEFSHTNYGAPWPNYEWLSEVVFYQIYQWGGMPLLTALCALLAIGSFVLAWRLTRGPIVDRVLLLALVLPLVTPGWSLRPQLFSLFFLPAAMHIVLQKRYLILPPLFALWANLHGAVALGMVVLVADFMTAVVSRTNRLRSAAFVVLSFGATLLTPLGASFWPEIWRSVNRSRVNMITEWMPPGLTVGYALFWLMAAALVWLIVTRWQYLERREDRTVVVLAVLLLVLALRASRNVVPFGLMATPAISILLWRRDVRRHPVNLPVNYVGTTVRAALFAVSLAAALLVVYQRWTTTPQPADWAPMSRQAAMAIRGCPGPIYNQYDVGGFIIWFVPEQKVFLDSRQDPYPHQLMKAQREATNPIALHELLARYHVRCAVLGSDSREVPALRALGWTESYRDRQWAVMTARAAGAR